VVVPRRAYTPTRPSCIECVEKHLGAACVLLTEAREGYACRSAPWGICSRTSPKSGRNCTLSSATPGPVTRRGEQMPDWQGLELILIRNRFPAGAGAPRPCETAQNRRFHGGKLPVHRPDVKSPSRGRPGQFYAPNIGVS
jgi:hypothetical protein